MQTLGSSQCLSVSSHRQFLSPVAAISGRSSSSCSLPFFPTLQCHSLHSPSPVMDETKFEEASRKGNLIPLHKCIFSDHLTPVLAYRCLVKEDDREAPSFLFESVDPGFGASSVGRYSVVGAQPAMEIVAKENKVTILDHEKGCLTEKVVDDPMSIPRSISESWRPQFIDELPDTFCGGWVGYFSYDTVRYVEKKKLPFPRAPQDDMNLADIHLGLYDDVIVFDHVEKKAYAIHWVRLDQYSSIEKAYDGGIKRLEMLVSRVLDIDPPRLSPGSVDLHTQHFGPHLKKSNMTSEEYKNTVLQAKEHILAGDIFEIVLSQRFERRTFADPFEVYRALRVVNPSPYMSYLQARGCILVASSPEVLTHVKKVTGELQNDLSCWDALCSALSVGTVSGAPKVIVCIACFPFVVNFVLGSGSSLMVKAMELIDQLEVTRRGPYAGGFGGISFSGEMDIALVLRTIIFPTGTRFDTMYSYKGSNKRQEWVAYLQAGAGIVADSVPDDKQRECENKAAGLARAIDLAELAFVVDK
ncbi:hypothetical protein HYC85_000301 [Camellia sinensis]|uniref:Anthranilate synthase n=1 Tax=Camellia sinensis TaxID=4442 RepID=A0A7J7I210_CAMSI|nr:hypothetical protein HYC85_000301 [Camellia sinensis]